ncbi:MAG TPA: sigma-70 family RNA polymerase sigma factor [Solirubrobacteraceae bacterium]|jgi:RNA polymerase sigma factor (sigma-70 family)|nr:sigma-70 family RNA polymerase sigma factor [Solirubrobacteraceae bacterium]
MSPAILRRYRAERMLQRDFQALRGQVLGTVSGRLRTSGLSLDRSDLEACYAQAWQGLYAATLGGEEIDNARAWLVLVTYRRAIEELRSRRERDTQIDGEPVHEPGLEGALDDRERLRRLLEGMRARLDVREREAAALCYLQGYSRSEAAARMGISKTRMRKVMEGSGRGEAGVARKVGAIVESIREGAFCEERDSLMRALAFGVLDPDGERHRLAMLHHRHCPACRRYVASLRGAAAVLPPVLTLPGQGAGGLSGLAGLGHHGAAGVSGAGAGSGASAGALGASAVAGGGGAAGGGWLLGGAGFGAKLAVGCLLALGVGAGCVALREPGSAHHAHKSGHTRRAAPARSLVTASSASVVLPPVIAAPAGDKGRVKTPIAHSAAARAAQEFGPEQPSQPASASTVTATAATQGRSEFGVSGSARARSAAAGGSSAAAQREFSPG